MFKITNAQLWVQDQEEALAFYTEKVGLTQAIPGQNVGCALYLFLVDHNAVCIGTDLFK